MVEQKLFRNLGLLLITDGKRSQLFKITREDDDEGGFVAEVLPFLPEPQDFLKIYPDANLIVTQDELITIDGTILFQYEKAKVSVELVSDKWLIIEDMLSDNDGRYRITFWDGQRENGYMYGRRFLRSEKYLAVYTASDNVWRVLTYDGKSVLKVKNVGDDVRICGDFLLTSCVGNYTAYALIKDKHKQPVFSHQQLVLCSSWDDFILYSNINGYVKTYYRGKHTQLGKIDAVEMFDRAGIFAIKKNGRYFLYKFNGKPVAENICPYGADKIAYNQEENSILIDTNGVLHII